MSKLVTIFGGSGFVGRYTARRMAKEGWRVRVAVRRPNEALFVKPYGVVGQVEPVFCNIRDDASVRAVMAGADAVVNCVGTFNRGGKNNFAAVQTEGAGRIARIAAEQGIGQPALAQRGKVGLFVKAAGEALEGRNLEDFAVHQIVARAQAIDAGIFAHRIAVNQLFHDLVKPAFGDASYPGTGYQRGFQVGIKHAF